ncbi:IclR family transcriptional regulator [Paracoccus sp. (in: a-proteobacteria)]|uniref:IclR family transcriptional regulator n=1 Tax=Paracoccus sp. TaxID=267 RepID=UPI002AFF9822|nr:IclR family transcriptional regulator [Paracoccus sp. (in: a-proteobacteria)]
MRSRKSLDSEEGPNSSFVNALARGLDILSSFRRGETSLGNKDFSERTGLSKSTVSRLTYTLHKTGYLAYDPLTSRYSLAPPVLSLGFSCLSGMSVLTLAKPKIEALANEVGAPVAIGGRDRLSMVYLECAKGSNAVILAIDVGVHLKLATSALGRAYIAALQDKQREEIFAALAVHEGESWPELRRGIEEFDRVLSQTRLLPVAAGLETGCECHCRALCAGRRRSDPGFQLRRSDTDHERRPHPQRGWAEAGRSGERDQPNHPLTAVPWAGNGAHPGRGRAVPDRLPSATPDQRPSFSANTSSVCWPTRGGGRS